MPSRWSDKGNGKSGFLLQLVANHRADNVFRDPLMQLMRFIYHLSAERPKNFPVMQDVWLCSTALPQWLSFTAHILDPYERQD